MSDTTELREVRLVGTRLARSPAGTDVDHFTWHADLSVAYLKERRDRELRPEDWALVNYTQGLRVLLQAPESDAAASQIRIYVEKDEQHPDTMPAIDLTALMREPHLLVGNIQPRRSTLAFPNAGKGYDVRAAVPEADADKGTITRGFSSLVLTPLDPWPTPQRTREIQVPRFVIAEQRLRVLIHVKGDQPDGFLRLAKVSDKKAAAFVGVAKDSLKKKGGLEGVPRVELDLIDIKGDKDGPYVAADLTPDGIEFRGTVVNPLVALKIEDEPPRVPVILRLVHQIDPLSPSETVWSLELVREEGAAPDKIGNRIRQALTSVRNAFSPEYGHPLVLDIDTVAENPAVRWPLKLEQRSLRLQGTRDGDWRLRVDANALRARLRGSAVRDGEMPTNVAFVPNVLELEGSAKDVKLMVTADRRDPAQQATAAPATIAGPCVTLKRNGAAPIRLSIAALPTSNKLTWLLDPLVLARDLAERYTKAGVHPAGARTTYAFVPLTEGWLQLPLPLDSDAPQGGAGAAGVKSDSVGFEGSVAFALDAPAGSGPRGRRMEIAAADHVSATATLDAKAGKPIAVATLQIELRGGAGSVDGLLWVANGSPSPENILPQFDAGPAALRGATLAFGRLKQVPAHLTPLISDAFAPNATFRLSLPMASKGPVPCYLWRGYTDLPLVTAISMTRTTESSSSPSSTRSLLCHEFDRALHEITLSYGANQGFASLTLTEKGKDVPLENVPLIDGEKGPFSQVPLVAVTLPGIELNPANAAFAALEARLRFDLPALDELFASTRLPEKAPVRNADAAPEPPPPDAPTALDIDGLRGAWQKAIDRLDLSRVAASNAFDFSPQAGNVKIGALFEGATWTTKFALSQTCAIDTTEYAFGAYRLDSEVFAGGKALQGLSKAFEVGARLVDAAEDAKNPLHVTGFAAALWEETRGELTGWRDTRAALTAKLPRTERLGNDKTADDNGLLLRDMAVIDPKTGSTAFCARATLARPIPIGLPAHDQRTLGLWFRDLPLATASAGQLRLVKDPLGPELTIGPSQGAFDRALLPRSIYEWRLCNDIKTVSSREPSSAYEIPLGPFRFRPLRLLDVSLVKAKGWSAGVMQMCGTLSLAKSGPSTLEAGPFEPELAYATGNLVAISLVKDGDGLTLARAQWEGARTDFVPDNKDAAGVIVGGSAELSFRLSGVEVLFGADLPAEGSTTALFGLTVNATADTDGLPQFSAATLQTVLFGRRVEFATTHVDVVKDALIAVFDAPAGAGTLDGASGVRLTRVTLTVRTGKPAQLNLHGLLRVAAAEASGVPSLDVVEYTLGGSLRWLNHEIAVARSLNHEIAASHSLISVDHRRGVMKIAGSPADETKGLPVQPITGLTASAPSIRFNLSIAFLPPEREKTASPAYLYTAVSGFGEYTLFSAGGPVRRFNHVVMGKEIKPDAVWTSRITVDLALESRESRIRWPIDSLPQTLKTLDTKKDVELDGLAARVRGRALRGSLGTFDAGKALRHRVTVTARGQSIATRLLRLEHKEGKPRVVFALPWTFHALTEHRVSEPQDQGRVLAWTTLDHVSAVDAHVLVAAAKTAVKLPQPFEKGLFAFAARYKDIEPAEKHSPVVKGGVVLRAFAQAGFPVEAIAVALAGLSGPIDDGLIVTGAGPTTVETKPVLEGPFWPDMSTGAVFLSQDRHGVLLALPWLTAIDANHQLGTVLSAFDQAPTATAAEWDAPDVDWSAGSPAPLARKVATVQPLGAGSATDIAALLARALPRATDASRVRALAPVDQVFLRPAKAGGALRERPIWLRSLLALRTVWLATADVARSADNVALIDDRVAMVVPSGANDGGSARFRLGPCRRPAVDDLLIGTPSRLIAIDRERTASEPIAATDLPGATAVASFVGSRSDALRRARLASRAEGLVKQPVAALAIAAQATPDAPATAIWIRVEIAPDADGGELDIPVELDAKARLYASPALGWPTARGTVQAATGAMGMGEDRAFQDSGPDTDPEEPASGPDDVKRYGSGLSGRSASLSLPARANVGGNKGLDPKEVFVDTRSPVFVALGRKMIFDRPTPKELPIVAPPARHLSPTEARAVVPTSQDLDAVLHRVVKGQAAPIVPPHLERTSFGLRPGAMQAEFDSLVFTQALDSGEVAAGQQEDMNPHHARFGRPGHSGPRLVRQLRPPRAPALPRVPLLPQDFVTSHGRRTFVEVDDRCAGTKSGGARFPTPFRLFEGAATILRRKMQSFRVHLQLEHLQPEWKGILTLRITSPSHAANTHTLAIALVQLGLLVAGREGLGAALSIDRYVVRFDEASWVAVGKDAIDLTLRARADDLASARARLDAVDGDSQVILQLRCAQESDTNVVLPPPTFALALQTGEPPTALEPESRRHVALRVPVRPTAQPSLNVTTSTLVFADPSYDRELSGPGPSDSQRDKDGLLWKLALDRYEYGTDTPVYFAFGPIDAQSGLFFKKTLKQQPTLTLQRQPARNDSGASLPPEHLTVANVKIKTGVPDAKPHEIQTAEAYGITFDRLRHADGRAVEFIDGDQIVVTVGFFDSAGVDRTLSVRATVVPRPVIAPPPAMYALVAPFEEAKRKIARVVLHATAPLPQRVEFPDLLQDLAVGHIRRRALFVWSTSSAPDASPRQATLVKIDRAGGGQLPERLVDIVDRL